MSKLRHFSASDLFWVSTTIIAALGALAGSAVAGSRESLVGPHPWDFPHRNRETSFAYQYARDNAKRNDLGAAAGIAGALGSTVIINSNTTSVGNWQQIEMTLGDGAEGLIMTENHQDNSGDTSAETRTLDNAAFVTESGSEESHAGDGERHKSSQHETDRESICGHNARNCWGSTERNSN